MSEARKKAKELRLGKLEAALKENLRRRKAQTRARQAVERGSDKEGATKGPRSGQDLV